MDAYFLCGEVEKSWANEIALGEGCEEEGWEEVGDLGGTVTIDIFVRWDALDCDRADSFVGT